MNSGGCIIEAPRRQAGILCFTAGKNRLGHNRLGLTVSAKLACAVKRNRIKRLFREAYRLHEDEFATGVDLVLVARARAVGATYQDIEKSLLRALRENKAAAAQP